MIASIQPPSGEEAVDWQKWAQNITQILGGFAAGWLAHIWSGRRERSSGRAKRLREFLVFLRTFRVEAGNVVGRYDAINHFPAYYIASIPIFCGEAEGIRRDFVGVRRKQFEILVGRISDSRYAHQNPDKLKEWLGLVDELIQFFDDAG
jgi:hypothetical protein